jgi:hypothetical protein
MADHERPVGALSDFELLGKWNPRAGLLPPEAIQVQEFLLPGLDVPIRPGPL